MDILSQPSFCIRCCLGPRPGLSVELGTVSILLLPGAPLHMAMGRQLGPHTPSCSQYGVESSSPILLNQKQEGKKG